MNRKYPHFAIPEIYGESLSYYEVLRKLVEAMNVVIENYDTIPDQIAEAVANLDASQLFSTVLNQLIHSIATDNTKSANAVKVYMKHDLLYASFNENVNLYESLIDFSTGTETELIPGTNIREVNISELFIELRKLIDINKNNIEAVTSVANENSAEITSIENKNTEQDNELSTLRTMISSPYNFKGDVANRSALPASGKVNDTYYVQDVKYKVTWTGSAWVQSSLSEADYQTELSELKSDIVNIDNQLGYIETFNLSFRAVNNSLGRKNIDIKKDKLYRISVVGNYTAGKISFSTLEDSTLVEEDFKVINVNTKSFYFVPNISANKLQIYTYNGYVGDNPLSIKVEEIELLSLNILYLSTEDRLTIKEDCIVYDANEYNLYLHKNGVWMKVYTENPSSIQPYEAGTNPVINKSQIADPSVIRFNNAFYLFSTGDKIPIYKSFDMINWDFIGYMMNDNDFNTVKTLTADFKGTWAPDVIKIGNKWVCYVSLADKEYVNKSKVIAFTANRPDEEWHYQKIVVDTVNNSVKQCIDPDVIIDNGIPYMFVGSFYNIYLFKLSDDGLTVDTSYTPKIIAKSGQVESSYIYKKDGYYYLFLSNGTSDKNGNYKLKVARSKTLDGIYYNKDGVSISNDGSLATTILEGNGVNTFSVGHNGDIFIDRNGKYFISFGGYTDKTVSRRLFIQEILWGEDGFPCFENEQCSLDFIIPKF